MKKGTFKGGVHPYEGKELSMDKPTVKLLPGKELVYPVSQHIGAPSKPCVAVGDHVLMGNYPVGKTVIYFYVIGTEIYTESIDSQN